MLKLKQYLLPVMPMTEFSAVMVLSPEIPSE